MAVTLKDKKYYSVVITDGSEHVSEYTTKNKTGAIEVADYINKTRWPELRSSKKSIQVLLVNVLNEKEVLTEAVYYIKYA